MSMLEWHDVKKKKRGGMLQTWTSSTAIEKKETCPTNQCKKELRPTLRSRITGARLTRGEANKPQDSSRMKKFGALSWKSCKDGVLYAGGSEETSERISHEQEAHR